MVKYERSGDLGARQLTVESTRRDWGEEDAMAIGHRSPSITISGQFIEIQLLYRQDHGMDRRANLRYLRNYRLDQSLFERKKEIR